MNKDNKSSSNDAYKNLELVNSWINNIDLKASFILAFLGILLGSILDANNLEILKDFVLVPISAMSFIELLKVIIVILLLISSAISAILLILTLLARVKISNIPKSNYFFGNISKMDRKEFLNNCGKMNEKAIKNDILNQVYINSKICDYKSKLYNKSIIFTITTIVLSFINYIFS